MIGAKPTKKTMKMFANRLNYMLMPRNSSENTLKAHSESDRDNIRSGCSRPEVVHIVRPSWKLRVINLPHKLNDWREANIKTDEKMPIILNMC